MPSPEIYRGDVVRVDLQPTKEHEKHGTSRPCVVVQNDIGNLNSPISIVIPLTDARDKKIYPFQVLIQKGDGGATKDSIACCEQIRVIDKTRIKNKMGHLQGDTIDKIDIALCHSLDL